MSNETVKDEERAAFEEIAARIHYPACWDTAAYPTLASTLAECAVWHDLRCGECRVCPRDRAASSQSANIGSSEESQGITLPKVTSSTVPASSQAAPNLQDLACQVVEAVSTVKDLHDLVVEKAEAAPQAAISYAAVEAAIEAWFDCDDSNGNDHQARMRRAIAAAISKP